MADQHKFHQHDADVAHAHDEEPEFIDPSEHDDAWAEALTPTEYVLSSDAAMASAIEQAEYDV